MADPVSLTIEGSIWSWIAGAAVVGAAGYEMYDAQKDSKKAMKDLMENKPASPLDTQADQAKAAEEAINRQRRIMLLTGGETNVTGGKGILSAGNVMSKTLLSG